MKTGLKYVCAGLLFFNIAHAQNTETLYDIQYGDWEVQCSKDNGIDATCMTIAHSLGIGPAGPTDLQQIVIARMDGPDHTLKFYAGFRNPDFEWQATPVLIKVDDGVPFQLHCVVIRGDCFFNLS